MTKALMRISTQYRPSSGDILGYRLQACIPNLAARKMVSTKKGIRATQTAVPAFRGQYLIAEDSDAAEPAGITPADIERFKTKLLWAGFDEVEMVETQASKHLSAQALAKQAEIDERINAMLKKAGFL